MRVNLSHALGRTLPGAACLLCALSVTSRAEAQAAPGVVALARVDTSAPPPSAPPRGWRATDTRLVVSVERITGFVAWTSKTHVESEFGTFERERSGTQLHALAASGSAGDGEDGVSFSSLPRVTFDFVLPVGITLGAIAGVTTTTGDEDVTIDGSEQAGIRFPDTTTLVLGGRVGFLIALSDHVALWPRVGAAFNAQFAFGAAGTEQSIRATQLLIDPALVLTPVSHVGVLFYPILDVGLGGSVHSKFVVSDLPPQTSDGSFRMSGYGAGFGLSALF